MVLLATQLLPQVTLRVRSVGCEFIPFSGGRYYYKVMRLIALSHLTGSMRVTVVSLGWGGLLADRSCIGGDFLGSPALVPPRSSSCLLGSMKGGRG
jgi:hypothetical protein